MKELGARKEAIVSAVVENYIRTGEPIGSKVLVSALDNAVSSATIRNDMADLCAKGFLEQPHTSAGRVPTAKAFRLYIDRLMPKRVLENARQEVISQRLTHAAGDAERLLNEAAQLLSEMTGCAALSTAPHESVETLRRVEFVRMSSKAVMVALLTSSGTLRSRLCRVDAAVRDEDLQSLCTLLNERFVGKSANVVGTAQLQQLLLAIGPGALSMVGLITGFHDLVSECVEADIQMSGQYQLLEKPDYHLENARSLLGFLSHRDRVTQILSAYSSGLHVLLGSESLCPELDGSSVIVTRYSPDGNQSGALALIGPVRMDYASAIPQLEYMARTVERLMAELW